MAINVVYKNPAALLKNERDKDNRAYRRQKELLALQQAQQMRMADLQNENAVQRILLENSLKPPVMSFAEQERIRLENEMALERLKHKNTLERDAANNASRTDLLDTRAANMLERDDRAMQGKKELQQQRIDASARLQELAHQYGLDRLGYKDQLDTGRLLLNRQLEAEENEEKAVDDMLARAKQDSVRYRLEREKKYDYSSGQQDELAGIRNDRSSLTSAWQAGQIEDAEYRREMRNLDVREMDIMPDTPKPEEESLPKNSRKNTVYNSDGSRTVLGPDGRFTHIPMESWRSNLMQYLINSHTSVSGDAEHPVQTTDMQAAMKDWAVWQDMIRKSSMMSQYGITDMNQYEQYEKECRQMGFTDDYGQPDMDRYLRWREQTRRSRAENMSNPFYSEPSPATMKLPGKKGTKDVDRAFDDIKGVFKKPDRYQRRRERLSDADRKRINLMQDILERKKADRGN